MIESKKEETRIRYLRPGDCTRCTDYLIEKKRVKEEGFEKVTAMDGILLTFSFIKNLGSIFRNRLVFNELDSIIQDRSRGAGKITCKVEEEVTELRVQN